MTDDPASSSSRPLRFARPAAGPVLSGVLRFAGLAQVTDPAALECLTGPIASIESSSLQTVGYTAARHERLRITLNTGERRSLVIKTIRPSIDWTACRTSDVAGREAAMLLEPGLAGIWRAFTCPYLALVAEVDHVVLVMEDLSPHLFPDVREPLRDDQEEALLAALATLHARYWSSPVLDDATWLARPEHFAGLLDACCAEDVAAQAPISEPLRGAMVRGWEAALKRMPPSVTTLMTTPAEDVAWLWADLPRTLLHGDSKVANFAIVPNRGVVAIDWAMIGAGPATIDIGWYLAVNSSRLAGSKEETLARYRALLEARLPEPISEPAWDSLTRCGLVVSARMLLWSKALALENDRQGARAEWMWWMDRLEAASRT